MSRVSSKTKFHLLGDSARIVLAHTSVETPGLILTLFCDGGWLIFGTPGLIRIKTRLPMYGHSRNRIYYDNLKELEKGMRIRTRANAPDVKGSWLQEKA